MGKDIVAGFEIVADSGIENSFAIDRLIAKTGAPGLEKVHTDGSAKDRALVGTEKILKGARESSDSSSVTWAGVVTEGEFVPIGTIPASSGRSEGREW